MMNTSRIQPFLLAIGATVLAFSEPPTKSSAAVLFSYDATTGQFPTDQGWQAYEIDTDGPLTAPNAAMTTSATHANAAMETVDGGSVLHMRDTLTDAPFDLPLYHYAWNPTQQQKLLTYGLKFTMVWQGLATTTSGKGNVRFGFNGTEFETQADNIVADRAIEILGFSSDLAPINGTFHTLVITGQFNAGNFELSRTVDGGVSAPLSIIANPSPGPVESSVYFGAQSGANRGADMYIRSVVMETLLVPEPASIALSLFALAAGVVARLRRSR